MLLVVCKYVTFSFFKWELKVYHSSLFGVLLNKKAPSFLFPLLPPPLFFLNYTV